MSSSWTGQAQARMSAAEVEERMLGTATDLVMEHGLTIGFDHLRIDDIIRAANVPRTSVYRRWKTKEAFFADFLPTLARPLSGVGSAYDEQTQTVAREVIELHADMLGTREGRLAVAREAVRLAVDQNFSAMAGDGRWAAYSALVATARNSPDSTIRDAVVPVVRAADMEFVTIMAAFYDVVLPPLKARFRPGMNALQFAATGAAVVEGLVVRRSLNPDLADVRVPGPAIDGGTTDWSLAATGFFGIMTQFVEFDD